MSFSSFFVLSFSLHPLFLTFLSFFFFCSLFELLMSSTFFLFFFFFFFFSSFFFYLKVLIEENFYFGLVSLDKFDLLVLSFFLFILSEVMVFFSLFWSHFHSFYSVNFSLGLFWVPKGLVSANPSGLIIFGTSILLSSSLVIMVSHLKLLLKFSFFGVSVFFLFNFFMGFLFLDIQLLELGSFFFQLIFNFFDCIFSCAFISTICLHSFHVFLGLIFLFFSFFFFSLSFNSVLTNLGFEMSVWYWHFVDYVWVFVFTVFYYFNV